MLLHLKIAQKRPEDALGSLVYIVETAENENLKSMIYSLTDNLKARDASGASKKGIFLL